MGSHAPPTLHTGMEQRHCKCRGHAISLNLQQKKKKKIQDQDLEHTKDLVSQHPPDSSEHLDQDDSKTLLSNTVQAHREVIALPCTRAAMAPGNRKTSTAVSAHLSTALMFISFASQRYDSSVPSAEDTATMSFQNTEPGATSHCP